jgi:monoterpene epsilon-lactone hydrolase
MLSFRGKLLNIIIHLQWYLTKMILYYRGINDPYEVIQYLRRYLEKIPQPFMKSIIKPIAYRKIKGYWIRSDEVPKETVILYLHGGAYIFRLLNIYKSFTSRLSIESNADVFLLDYRLAPEYVFPAPLEDSLNAYQYLLDLGYRPDQIIIAGDSAGGGLAMATLVALRDANKLMPAGYVGISPWFDLALTGASLQINKNKDFVVEALDVWIESWIKFYLQGTSPFEPLVSPLYAEISNLPPLFIHVGENEVLLDDSQRFKDKAVKAGITITLEIWKNMPHDWHLFSWCLPEGQQAIKKIGKYIRNIQKK